MQSSFLLSQAISPECLSKLNHFWLFNDKFIFLLQLLPLFFRAGEDLDKECDHLYLVLNELVLYEFSACDLFKFFASISPSAIIARAATNFLVAFTYSGANVSSRLVIHFVRVTVWGSIGVKTYFLRA